MEKYKAKKNNNDNQLENEEEIPKTQDEKNIENNENTLKNVAEVAEATGNPYAVAAAKAFKAADKISGGKSTQMLAKNINTANKIAPGGKQVQDASNKLSESGAGDKIGQAAAAKNSKGTNVSKSKSGTVSGKSKNNNGPVTSNIMGSLMDKIPTSLKIKIYVGIAILFLSLAIFVTVFAEQDEINSGLTNNSNTALLNTSGSRACTNEEIENKLIYLGDSRIVGMQQSINKENVSYIAESGKGYDWLVNSARGSLDTLLNENPNQVVVLALGANGLGADNYITYYKELFNEYPNTKFFIMSVNPVDESKTKENNYEITNSQIEDFNTKIKNSFSDKYIDAYNGISEYTSGDGVHYDASTYQKVHEYTVSSIQSSNKVMCGGSENLLAALEEVGKWYIENVPTYWGNRGQENPRKYYQTPFASRAFGDDCTEFVALYMSYVSGADISSSSSHTMVLPNSSWAQEVAKLNWKVYSSDEAGSLQPGDVMIAHGGTLYSDYGEHGEVYIDESHTFGWGSVKSVYPTNNTVTTTKESDGHVHFKDSSHDYITIYRYEGSTTTSNPTSSDSSSIEDLNVTKMFDDSFNHGTKPKSNQKYIMLHDTAMTQDAKTVIKSWKNSGNGVAAHFVIDRDGTIIQAVDLDTITHHAGWGGPGNFDKKYGVGNNDGKGNGDDLVGTKPLSGYTSYGMNSYSIGIEICHVAGEEYPEVQLKALDKVIAYIDSYYGFESTIIDHKEWRPSNGDTDKEKFSTYLNNYKTTRKH